MEMDLSVASYETWDDLLVYMDGSAAVIGEMMLPILEPRSPKALVSARNLGLAFQLTNFLRDVAEDLDRDRVYLPQEDLARFGSGPPQAGRRRAVASAHAVRDRTVPSSSTSPLTRGWPTSRRASARCVRAARILYSRILDVIEANDYDVFSARARVRTWRKAQIVGPAHGRREPCGVIVVVALAGLGVATYLLGRMNVLASQPSVVEDRPSATGSRPTPAGCPSSFPLATKQPRCRSCSQSLRALDPAPQEIIVVDDGSEDDTAGVASAGGAVVIAAAPPPEGWLGKPWACHTGALAATGSHILFLDADVRLAPVGARRARRRPRRPGWADLRPAVPPHVGAVRGALGVLQRRCADGHRRLRRDEPRDVSGRLRAMPVHVGRRLPPSGRPRRRAGRDHRGHPPRPSLPGRRSPGHVLHGRRARAVQDVPRRPPPARGGVEQERGCRRVGGGTHRGRRSGALGRVARCGRHRHRGWCRRLGTRCGRGARHPGRPRISPVAIHQWWVLRRIGSFRWTSAAVFPVPLAAFIAIFLRSVVLTRLRREVTWRGRRIRVRQTR